MTLATACSSFWLRAGLGAPTPGVWIGSADETVQEVVEFAREALRMVVEAHEWEALTRTYTAELTGVIEQVVPLPSDFGRLIPQTVRLSNDSLPIRGPLSEAEYESLKRPVVSAAQPVFRMSNGALDLLALPGASGSLSLRYITGQPVNINGGGTRETWGADSDAAQVDERLVTLGMIALWRDARGLNASSAATLYTNALSRAKAQDRPMGVMALGNHRIFDGNSPKNVAGFVVNVGTLS